MVHDIIGFRQADVDYMVDYIIGWRRADDYMIILWLGRLVNGWLYD